MFVRIIYTSGENVSFEKPAVQHDFPGMAQSLGGSIM
jgi:hypothetical protein